MPNLRIQYFRGPVWGKTNDQLRKQIVEGNNPITGGRVMQEIIGHLTRPLTAEEKKTGRLDPGRGPATFTGTPDELQQLFLEKRMTDFLPVTLPTGDKVEEMLKATSHEPDEILGKMNPGSEAGDVWTYTVRDAAVNAVMAGARPEHFPVILALGSTGMTPVNVSDNGFMAGAVINGAIREEIGLNSDIGAVGPYAHANTTIGRAWNLLSINGGNCGKVGTTYMGTVGNPMNAINIIIAENEENSPFEPFSVRKGFEKGQNIITLFTGWGVLSAKNWKANVWGTTMDYPKIIKDIFDQQGFLFGACAVLSPPIAQFIKNAGYDTVEKFERYLEPAPQFPMGKMAPPKAKPEGGAQAKPAPKAEMPPMMGGFSNTAIIVTGGTNNNYYSIGGLRYGRSVKIDDWR